ncbi:MAG: hypothetical protein JRD68_08940, partial [Deltaproteobacteria bacterium]|nr:hypothetical protein [Deltaproteobacteria bacterium]
EKWVWECDLEARLKDNPYAFTQDERQLKGRVSGLIYVKGRVPDVTVSAEIKAEQNVLSSNELGLEPFEIKASLSLQYPRIDITGAAILIPRAKITLGGKDIQITEIDIQIPQGSADVEKGSIAFPEIRFDSSGLRNLRLSVALAKDGKQVEITGRETSLLQAASLYYPPPPDWKFSSRDAVQIEASAGETGPWNVQARLTFDALTFEASQGNILGDNISLTAIVESTIDLEQSKMDFSASLAVGEGEALYDRYYLNLKKNPIKTSGVGVFHLQNRLLELAELKFSLAHLLPLELQGTFRQDQTGYNTDFKLTVPRARLKPIFQQFVREPHKAEKPFLETIEPGGAISAELEINGFLDNLRVTGRIGWHEGELALTKQDILLKRIQLDLPVWYQARPGNHSGEPLIGRLEVRSMKVPLLPEQPLDISLEVGPNRISIDIPTLIKTPGGDIQLGPVRAKEIFSSKREVRTSLTVDELQMQPVAAQFWDKPVIGSMSGKLDPVIYREHIIESQGEIQASVFGGRIKLSNLSATGILASTPVYKINVEGNNLRLSQITEGTSFGKIEGVLSGYVRDVEIAFGQPQKFDMLLETIKRDGIPQRISVKAIDNIAQLGGGQSPFMGGLAGTFASFFKEFPYKKIGVRSTLENDMFTINGTIKEGGTEYIIKRSGFSGVNVVNQNVDNRISFKDMVKRVKRISDTEGPIVK